jgi:hypothetical protein
MPTAGNEPEPVHRSSQPAARSLFINGPRGPVAGVYGLVFSVCTRYLILYIEYDREDSDKPDKPSHKRNVKRKEKEIENQRKRETNLWLEEVGRRLDQINDFFCFSFRFLSPFQTFLFHYLLVP